MSEYGLPEPILTWPQYMAEIPEKYCFEAMMHEFCINEALLTAKLTQRVTMYEQLPYIDTLIQEVLAKQKGLVDPKLQQLIQLYNNVKAGLKPEAPAPILHLHVQQKLIAHAKIQLYADRLATAKALAKSGVKPYKITDTGGRVFYVPPLPVPWGHFIYALNRSIRIGAPIAAFTLVLTHATAIGLEPQETLPIHPNEPRDLLLRQDFSTKNLPHVTVTDPSITHMFGTTHEVPRNRIARLTFNTTTDRRFREVTLFNFFDIPVYQKLLILVRFRTESQFRLDTVSLWFRFYHDAKLCQAGISENLYDPRNDTELLTPDGPHIWRNRILLPIDPGEWTTIALGVDITRAWYNFMHAHGEFYTVTGIPIQQYRVDHPFLSHLFLSFGSASQSSNEIDVNFIELLNYGKTLCQACPPQAPPTTPPEASPWLQYKR